MLTLYENLGRRLHPFLNSKRNFFFPYKTQKKRRRTKSLYTSRLKSPLEIRAKKSSALISSVQARTEAGAKQDSRISLSLFYAYIYVIP